MYDRNYEYLGVRGYIANGNYNTNVIVLVDGHRANESVYDSFGLLENFVVDLDDIERIEFIRGPASSVYGNNALFGVINVITREINKNQFESVTDYGSYDRFKQKLAYQGLLGDWKFRVSASYFDSDGDKDLFYKEFESGPHTNFRLDLDISAHALRELL